MNYRIFFLAFFAVVLSSSVGFTEDAGILTVTAKYIDSGTEKPLENAYLYLHESSKKPHPQKFAYNKPLFVLGPSDSSGRISTRVTAGTYFIRITKRNDESTGKLGAPQSTDYTWSQPTPITITRNATTDLGTKYASLFTAPATITGTVALQTGEPQTGRYIRALTSPCLTDNGYDYDLDQCGTDRPAALKRTDMDGRFTLEIRDPGTFYVYTSACRGGAGCTGEYAGSVTIQPGETQILNIVNNN